MHLKIDDLSLNYFDGFLLDGRECLLHGKRKPPDDVEMKRSRGFNKFALGFDCLIIP